MPLYDLIKMKINFSNKQVTYGTEEMDFGIFYAAESSASNKFKSNLISRVVTTK